jgi:integrase
MSTPTFTYIIRTDAIPSNGICPIYLQYIYQSGHTNIPTGLKVHHKQWSKDAAMPATSCENRDEIMQKMSDYKTVALKVIEERLNYGGSLMLKDVKLDIVSKLNKQVLPSIKMTFDAAFQKFIEIKQNKLKPSTIQMYKTMKNLHLQKYCEENKIDMSWALFNLDFRDNWVDYFISHKKQNTTMAKNFKRLHTFLEWAHERKYLLTDEFRSWESISEQGNEPIICTEKDISQIIKFARNPEKNQSDRMIADFFIFLCNTGLRISDFINLTYKNLNHQFSGNGNEKYTLKIFSQKTAIDLTIPLTDDALDCILDYNPDLKSTFTVYTYFVENVKDPIVGYMYEVNPVIAQHPDKRLFPKIYSQDFNEQIKVIGDSCGINSSCVRTKRYGVNNETVYVPKYKLLTCHTARRTFITTALQAEIPIPVIMKYTGHTSYKSIARYFSISVEYMQMQAEKFNATAENRPQTAMEQNFKRIFR